MNNINLNFLKIFMEVANSNSFLEASNKLYITQPAISRSIAKLEEDLGVVLFYRANKGIALTPSGEVLLKYIKESGALLETCQRVLTSMNDIEQGNIVIGVQSHIVRNYLMDKVCSFRKKHPNIKMKFLDLSTSLLIDELEKRHIDFVIDTSPIEIIYNNITIKPIKNLNTCFIKSKENSTKITELTDLEKQCMILPDVRSSLRRNLDKCLNEIGVNVEPKLEFVTEELIIDAVKRNAGIGYVVESSIKNKSFEDYIDIISFNDQLPNIEINLVYIEKNLTNVSKLFIDEVILNEDSNNN